MKKSRFTDTQILANLADANDKPVVEVCRLHNSSVPTFQSWKSRHAGMNGEELRQKRPLGDLAFSHVLRAGGTKFDPGVGQCRPNLR